MVKASKNLSNRVKLLKEQLQLMQVCRSNNRKLDKTVYKDFLKSLKYCKRLYKEEILKADINSLL